MNDTFFKKCFFIVPFSDDSIYEIFEKVLYRKEVLRIVSKKCFGMVLPGFESKKHGFLVSREHPGLLHNMRCTKTLKSILGIREKYINHLRSLIKFGVIPFFPDNFDYIDNAIVFCEGSIMLLRTEENRVIIPSILTYKGWVDVTKELKFKEYRRASFPKRQSLIFNTIRHSIGIYDKAWQCASDETYGHICRQFVRMVCTNFPELDTVAKEWLLFKEECGVDIDSDNIDFFDEDKFTMARYSESSK